jgi:hypothetical protein
VHQHETHLLHGATDPAATAATSTTTATTAAATATTAAAATATAATRVCTRPAYHRPDSVDVDDVVNHVAVFDSEAGVPGSLPARQPGVDVIKLSFFGIDLPGTNIIKHFTVAN